MRWLVFRGTLRRLYAPGGCLEKIRIYPFGSKTAENAKPKVLITKMKTGKQLYTRGGDKGETSLYGAGRVPKDSVRVDAYGTIDELNSCVGLSLSLCKSKALSKQLRRIQGELFVAGADLASTGKARVPRITRADTERLEGEIDDLQGELPRLTSFILPGGTQLSASLHLARSVCRRAERRVVALSRDEKVNSEMVPYLNRLSTYLFNVARYANSLEKVKDEVWKRG